MIPDNAIRELDFPKEDIESCNTTYFVNMFKEISQIPWKSKGLKNRVVLGFSIYDNDPRPNYGILEIRRFVQAIDASLPHLPYFLWSEPSVSHILFYMQCLIDVDATDSKYTFSSQDLVLLIRKKIVEVKRFCDKIADEADSVAEGMILNLPPEILVSGFPEYAIKALNSMKVFFKPLLDDKLGQKRLELPPEIKAEYILAYEEAMYLQAEKLSGLQRTSFSSDIDFLKAILHIIEKQSNI